MAERLNHNQKVAGSSPASATTYDEPTFKIGELAANGDDKEREVLHRLAKKACIARRNYFWAAKFRDLEHSKEKHNE